MGKLRTPAVLVGSALATAAGFAALQIVLGLAYGRTAEEIVRRSASVGGAVLAVGLVATAWVLVGRRRSGPAGEDPPRDPIRR